MSGGHWDYGRFAYDLEQIAEDETVCARWPRIAALLTSLAPLLKAAEREMDWDICSDSHIKDDAAFQDRVCHAILEAAMKAADERLFPRGKWATIQAIQGRMEEAPQP